MYKEDAMRQPHDFHRIQVDQILHALHPTYSFTIFAPSGFGKSTVLKYICYNHRYRRRHRHARRWRFIYMDMRDVAVVIEDYLRRVRHEYQTPNFEKVIEAKILEAVERSAPIVGEDLHQNLSRLLSGNDEYFLVLDNFETLHPERFADARNYFRVLRDKYKPSMEFVFAVSSLDMVSNLSRPALGPIADLMSQKLGNMTLGSVARDVYSQHLLLLPFWSRVFRRFDTKTNTILKRIDYLSGGYPQYAKVLVQNMEKDTNIDKFVNSREMYAATERLLSSLNKNCIRGLCLVAKERPKTLANVHYADLMLRLGIIKNTSQGFMLFSPVFHNHLLQRCEVES